MKHRIFIFALCILAVLILARYAGAETINWNNATQYTDNSAISAADQATIVTRIYHGATAGTATALLATVTGGGETWTGAIPYTRGQTGYFAATNEVGGQVSGPSPAVSYTVPAPGPKAPTTINITRP